MAYIGKTPTPSPLTSSDITDGIITTTKIADANVTNPKLTSGSQQNFRNIIINGDMSQAQRGTSTSSITGTAYNTIDRFQTNISSMGTWTQSQSTDVPTGQGFSKSLKMDCTTADASPAASDVVNVRTKFEGQNLQYLKKGTSSAQSLTLSFWVKSNKTGTYIAELYDTDNNRQISQSYTISSANTWENKTVTFAGDTTGAFTNDNAESLRCTFYLGAGSDWTSGTLSTSWQSYVLADRVVGQVNLADSTSNEFYLTGVQLEAGTSASDFEFLPVDVNLQRCQRYFEVCSGDRIQGSQTYVSSRVYFNPIRFMVTKRSAPTITNATASFTLFYNSGYDTSVTWNVDDNITTQFTLTMTSTRDYGFMGSGSDMFKADSEL